MTDQPLISVDRESWVPAAEQIRTSIAQLAGSGVLPSGHPLPTVRQLARDLGLAAGTVARAYRALETDGVIQTRGRRGSFIAAEAARPPESADGLRVLAHRYLAEAAALGYAPAQAVAAVRQAIAG